MVTFTFLGGCTGGRHPHLSCRDPPGYTLLGPAPASPPHRPSSRLNHYLIDHSHNLTPSQVLHCRAQCPDRPEAQAAVTLQGSEEEGEGPRDATVHDSGWEKSPYFPERAAILPGCLTSRDISPTAMVDS